MPFDLTAFSLADMLRCGLDLRKGAQSAATLEDAANNAVSYLYEQCVEPGSDSPACALVRCYRTVAFRRLPDDLQEFARNALDGQRVQPETRCLTLLATRGSEKSWNDRRSSRGHQAIPLPSVEMVQRAPMIAGLIREFGMDLQSVVAPTPEISLGAQGKTYNTFHVPDALGSPYIPAQDFVRDYAIRSVLGFGGTLRSGDLYAVILFSRVDIPFESADRFRTLALDLKTAFYFFEDDAIFSD